MVDSTRSWWARHGWDVIYDVAPPTILLALGLIDVFTGIFAVPVGTAPAVTALIPGALACAALLFRRRRPLLTLTAILVLVFLPPLLLPTALTYWDEFAVWLVALYSCARHRPLRWGLVGLAASAGGLVLLVIEFPDLRHVGDIVYNGFLMVLAFGIGLLARSWTAYRGRALRAAAERAVAEERAAQAERSRIAREIHDLISHTITVIVMQAGGARLAAQSDPALAVEALGRIERLGQDSLAELRTLLAVLRDPENPREPPGAPAPQPTLADIPELCERMRGLGLPVSLLLSETVGGLPAGIQLAGFRVVQEGLTNVLKHAGPVDTEVSVGWERNGVLRLEVSNAPGRPGGSVPSGRRGLMGLRERVAAVGGVFSAGTRSDGGFVISAGLPVGLPAGLPAREPKG